MRLARRFRPDDDAQACHFQLPGALEAIKKSLTLVWRTEPAIETAIKNAFVQVNLIRLEGPRDIGRDIGAIPRSRDLPAAVHDIFLFVLFTGTPAAPAAAAAALLAVSGCR